MDKCNRALSSEHSQKYQINVHIISAKEMQNKGNYSRNMNLESLMGAAGMN